MNARRLPGKPDVAFIGKRVAVFVDGAFWHGHPKYFDPSRVTDYWRDKVARTVERDRHADRALALLGWHVLRVWDYDVLRNPDESVQLVKLALRQRDRLGTKK